MTITSNTSFILHLLFLSKMLSAEPSLVMEYFYSMIFLLLLKELEYSTRSYVIMYISSSSVPNYSFEVL